MKRADFSRMVILDLAPTEANAVAGALTALLLLDRDRGPILDNDAQRLALAGAVEAIDRQLVRLMWPTRGVLYDQKRKESN